MQKYKPLLSAQLPYHIAAMLREQMLGTTGLGPSFEAFLFPDKTLITDLHDFMRGWLENV